MKPPKSTGQLAAAIRCPERGSGTAPVASNCSQRAPGTPSTLKRQRSRNWPRRPPFLRNRYSFIANYLLCFTYFLTSLLLLTYINVFIHVYSCKETEMSRRGSASGPGWPILLRRRKGSSAIRRPAKHLQSACKALSRRLVRRSGIGPLDRRNGAVKLPEHRLPTVELQKHFAH